VRRALEQLFLPAECLLCHALLGFDRSREMICPVCRHRFRPIVPPWCARCGQPEPLFGTCRICREWPPALRYARSAVWLDPAARRAVHAFKYGGLPRLAADLTAMLERVPVPDRDRAVLVPIPLARGRLARRGFNQSERLARLLARRWRRPVAELLVRGRETPTQTTLTPAARVANVAGAFSVGKAQSALSSPLILVDDVFTTGATLASAARALEDAGARSIAAVTFGRAIIPDFT
jgi:ComF family protein